MSIKVLNINHLNLICANIHVLQTNRNGKTMPYSQQLLQYVGSGFDANMTEVGIKSDQRV